MIMEKKGDIFLSQADYITIPVNTVGVAGAGLAKQFAQKFPVYLRQYQALCHAGKLNIGGIYLLQHDYARAVILFPTKSHWKYPSTIHYIYPALIDLRDELIIGNIRGVVAIPRLGCGLGGLDWEGKVYPLIKNIFSNTQHKIEVYT